MVVVPEDEAKVTVTGMNSGMVRDMGDHQVRMFAAKDLELGKTVTLAISGIPVAAHDHDHDRGAEGAMTKSTGFSAKNMAMGGAFLMVLMAVGMMLMKKPTVKKA
jgi:hypothetical protein